MFGFHKVNVGLPEMVKIDFRRINEFLSINVVECVQTYIKTAEPRGNGAWKYEIYSLGNTDFINCQLKSTHINNRV